MSQAITSENVSAYKRAKRKAGRSQGNQKRNYKHTERSHFQEHSRDFERSTPKLEWSEHPVFLFGHSFGAAVHRHLLHRHQTLINIDAWFSGWSDR